MFLYLKKNLYCWFRCVKEYLSKSINGKPIWKARNIWESWKENTEFQESQLINSTNINFA